MNKYICIHGHFYQPPRENPWLNEVELQESAYPFHDWNQRITSECYARNAASRILGEEKRIVDIVNNYSRISFNFGPTLLVWLQKKSPETYEALLKADKRSLERFSGHGSALAQAFNHMIMPLANERDKHTQVIWGIEDFKSRFGRAPEGMWVGETAVDTPTLEVLAEHGIKFTILSPYQAKSFRKIGDEKWKNAEGAKIEPKRAYLCKLPSGNEINLFFYDGPVSQGIAFEGLLKNGEEFYKRLSGQLGEDADEPQLMHIATDGESYGHHHRFGEMALSYCLHEIENDDVAEVTVYGEFLEKHPPQYEAQIIENTSWSCAHGVERWKSDCGCNTGGNEGWHQEWRAPLREAFDWLREECIPIYEEKMGAFVDDPWEVRNKYIHVILDRSRENVEKFISENTKKELNHDEKVQFLKLLEMQYHCMLMYTSCGWFFDEVTGIETMQDVMYAARTMQLANELTERDFESEFIQRSESIPANNPDLKNLAAAYKKFVKPTMLDMLRVGAHYAVSSLFEDYPEKSSLYSFTAENKYYKKMKAGRYSLAVGRSVLRSEVTWEEKDISFAVLHLGDHDLFGGVREFQNDEAFDQMHREVEDSFRSSNVYEMIMLLDKHFETHSYSFWHLFKDDQRKVLARVMSKTIEEVENLLSGVYEKNYPLMQALRKLNMEIPQPLCLPLEFTVNGKLKDLLVNETADNNEALKRLIDEIKRLDVKLDLVILNYLATQKLERMMQRIEDNPDDPDNISKISRFLNLLGQAGIEPDRWRAQNIAFFIKLHHYEKKQEEKKNGNEDEAEWLENFNELYEQLNMKV